MSLAAAACSTMWAHQPTVRLTANVGVNIVLGSPAVSNTTGVELDVAGERSTGLQFGEGDQDLRLDGGGELHQVAAEAFGDLTQER